MMGGGRCEGGSSRNSGDAVLNLEVRASANRAYHNAADRHQLIEGKFVSLILFLSTDILVSPIII